MPNEAPQFPVKLTRGAVTAQQREDGSYSVRLGGVGTLVVPAAVLPLHAEPTDVAGKTLCRHAYGWDDIREQAKDDTGDGE